MQIGCSIFITCTLGFEFILSEGVYHKTNFFVLQKELQELQKRLVVLGCQLRKAEVGKRTYEVATDKLIHFAEVQRGVFCLFVWFFFFFFFFSTSVLLMKKLRELNCLLFCVHGGVGNCLSFRLHNVSQWQLQPQGLA